MYTFFEVCLVFAAKSYDLPTSWTTKSPATLDAESHSSGTAEAEAATEPKAASAAQPEAGVSGLESFLHTVTTADEILNDLLGELSGSSSSCSPAQLSRQSSSSVLWSLSALPKLAGQQNISVTSANSNAFALASPAAGALQPSSSAQQDATGIHASSSAALHSDMLHSELPSPRSTTDAVLDTLLEDLKSAELARQSSSAVLLSRLTSLAEMCRRSACSSPVPETSQADMMRQAPSSSELSVVATNCDSADPHVQSASSQSAEPSCGFSQSSSSPLTLAVSQQLLSCSSYKALKKPDEEDGQDYAAATPAMKKDAGNDEEMDKEGVMKLQTAVTSDLVLDELLDVVQLAAKPESTANKVSPSH